MGNPLFNELIIGTGFKDLWSRSDPKDDAQFAAFALDPLIARVAQAAYSAIGVVHHPDAAAHRPAAAGHLRPADRTPGRTRR